MTRYVILRRSDNRYVVECYRETIVTKKGEIVKVRSYDDPADATDAARCWLDHGEEPL